MEMKCPGLKENGKWCTRAHKDRIVHFTDNELRVLSQTFEEGENWESVTLSSIHSTSIIGILSRLSGFSKHVRDYESRITVALNETTDVDRNIIKRETCIPNFSESQLIYSGPHIQMANPIAKTPRPTCSLSSDYDVLDLNKISEDYIPLTNYIPACSLKEFHEYIQGFIINYDHTGSPVYDLWIDYYRIGFREFVGANSERTLIGAILPKNCSHIYTIDSVAFRDNRLMTELAGLGASIVLDFYIKAMGVSHVSPSRIQKFPLGIEEKYLKELLPRTLSLNCLTIHYKELWEEIYNESFKECQWSQGDKRLKNFNTLTHSWKKKNALTNYYERHLALEEIDVIVAMALGLSLKDLEMIYRIQFPVLQQNEEGTWYDQTGNIVFTCSRGLIGVGVERTAWENIKNQKEGETYVHTIDPAKSELYGGQQVTYYAPYTKCDRIEDYRRAWAHFEKIFKEEE